MVNLVPDSSQMALAVKIYMQLAYPNSTQTAESKLGSLPAGDLFEWLNSGVAELNPPDADIDDVRRYSLRLGNSRYPYMKLTLSRHIRSTGEAGGEATSETTDEASHNTSDQEAGGCGCDAAATGPWIFAVDSHDLMLHGREGFETEIAEIEALKEYNRLLAKDIHTAWQDAGLLTEHAWLRWQIQEFS